MASAGEICDRIAVMYAGELLEDASADIILKDQQHPYTQGFIRALPSRGLRSIPGISPSLIDTPSGCRFHPRCCMAMDICKRERPEIEKLATGHYARCFVCS